VGVQKHRHWIYDECREKKGGRYAVGMIAGMLGRVGRHSDGFLWELENLGEFLTGEEDGGLVVPAAIEGGALAFTQVGYPGGDFWASLERRAGKFEAHSDAPTRANVLWALAASASAGRRGALLTRLWAACAAGELGEEQLLRLGEARVLAWTAGVRLPAAPARLEEEIGRAEAAARKRRREGKLVREITRALDRTKVAYERDVPLAPGSPHLIDVALPDLKVAVHLDEKDSFMWGRKGEGTGRDTGFTKARLRALRRAGWHVLRVRHTQPSLPARQGGKAKFGEWLREGAREAHERARGVLVEHHTFERQYDLTIDADYY
jgi:hypothetical protein